MELTFEKHDLLHALQILQGVASGRNTLPILSNVPDPSRRWED